VAQGQQDLCIGVRAPVGCSHRKQQTLPYKDMPVRGGRAEHSEQRAADCERGRGGMYGAGSKY